MPIDSVFGEDSFADDDEEAPEIQNRIPAPSTPIDPAGSFSFDVIDDVGLDVLRFEVRQSSGWEVAFEEGAFTPRYLVNSTVAEIEDGFHFVIRRNTGWVRSPVDVRVRANDTEGNEA